MQFIKSRGAEKIASLTSMQAIKPRTIIKHLARVRQNLTKIASRLVGPL